MSAEDMYRSTAVGMKMLRQYQWMAVALPVVQAVELGILLLMVWKISV